MTTVQMLLLKNLMEPLLMVKKSKLTVPEVVVAVENDAMEALVEVAEVASVVAEVAIAETATEAIAAAAEVGMEVMEVAKVEDKVVMTRDPIKKDSYGYDRRELKITAILLINLQKCCKIQFI